MKPIKYILLIIASYITSSLVGVMIALLICGGGWNDVFATTALSLIFQFIMLIGVWVDGSFIEQISIGIGILVFISSFYVTYRTKQRNHILWGVVALNTPLAIATAVYVIGLLYR